MKTTILQPSATSILNGGLYEMDGKFYNKYNDEVTSEWACYLVWSSANSKKGDQWANQVEKQFKQKYSIN